MRKAIMVLALLAASSVSMPARSQDSSQQWQWCVNKDDEFSHDLAISGCTAVIQSGQETTENLAIAFSNRGLAYHDLEQFDRAIKDYDQAIRLKPDFVDAYKNRALAHSAKHQHDRVVEDYSQVVRLAPENADAWNGRCWHRAILGQLQAALSDCNESLRLRPNDAATIDSRAFVLLKMGNLSASIGEYNQSLRLRPQSAYSSYGRGIAKLRFGDTEGGNADIAAAKAIKADIGEEFARMGVSP